MSNEESAVGPAIREAEGARTELVYASFENLDEADAATRDLLARGFSADRIVVLLSDETRAHSLELHPEWADLDHSILSENVQLEQGHQAAKGAGIGGTIGGTVGAVGAAVAAIGTSVLIPALGIVVAGPLAAALAGAGAGGAAGGLIGALAGAGITEYRAKHFESLVNEGGIIVGALPLTMPEVAVIEEIFDDHDGDLLAAHDEE